MVVAVTELDLELDSREERRGRPEHQLVPTGHQVSGQLGDAAVGVRLAGGVDRALPCELDTYPGSRLPEPGVVDVRVYGCTQGRFSGP